MDTEERLNAAVTDSRHPGEEGGMGAENFMLTMRPTRNNGYKAIRTLEGKTR